MTSRNGYSITWTSYNQPSLINAPGESISFDYDQSHQRWRAVYTGPNGTETTYLIGGLLEQVVDVGDTDYRHYIYAGGEKVAIVSRTTSGVNTVRYIREDHLGGVAGIENPDGTSYVKESFTAYGGRRSSCTWTGPPTSGQLSLMATATRRGFTWHTALGTMGLNDMNGRVEDAVTGRCLSPDPFVSNPNDTQEYNRYSYVRNDPLTFTDPSGFLACTSGGYENISLGDTYGGSGPNDQFVQGNRELLPLPDICFPEPSFQPIAPPNFPPGPPPVPTPGAPTPTPSKPSTPPPSGCPRSSPHCLQLPQTHQDQCKNSGSSSNRSFGDKVSDSIVGFGDAFLIPILVRNALGIGNGNVDTNSSAYTGGEIAGTIWGLIPFALDSAATYSAAQAARGTPSILNANPYFRIGPGRWGGDMVPRISSPYLPGDGHYNLSTRVPPIPPLGALASGNGC